MLGGGLLTVPKTEVLAEVDPLYLGVAAQFPWGPCAKNLAFEDDVRAVRYAQGFRDIVIGDQDSDALRLQIVNDLLDFQHGNRINP